MADLADKLFKLKELHKDITDKKNRLEGQLEADQKALKKLEKELKEEGIQPDELETEIKKLEEELTKNYSRLEEELNSINKEVRNIESQCT